MEYKIGDIVFIPQTVQPKIGKIPIQQKTLEAWSTLIKSEEGKEFIGYLIEKFKKKKQRPTEEELVKLMDYLPESQRVIKAYHPDADDYDIIKFEIPMFRYEQKMAEKFGITLGGKKKTPEGSPISPGERKKKFESNMKQFKEILESSTGNITYNYFVTEDGKQVLKSILMMDYLLKLGGESIPKTKEEKIDKVIGLLGVKRYMEYPDVMDPENPEFWDLIIGYVEFYHRHEKYVAIKADMKKKLRSEFEKLDDATLKSLLEQSELDIAYVRTNEINREANIEQLLESGGVHIFIANKKTSDVDLSKLEIFQELEKAIDIAGMAHYDIKQIQPEPEKEKEGSITLYVPGIQGESTKTLFERWLEFREKGIQRALEEYKKDEKGRESYLKQIIYDVPQIEQETGYYYRIYGFGKKIIDVDGKKVSIKFPLLTPLVTGRQVEFVRYSFIDRLMPGALERFELDQLDREIKMYQAEKGGAIPKELIEKQTKLKGALDRLKAGVGKAEPKATLTPTSKTPPKGIAGIFAKIKAKLPKLTREKSLTIQSLMSEKIADHDKLREQSRKNLYDLFKEQPLLIKHSETAQLFTSGSGDNDLQEWVKKLDDIASKEYPKVTDYLFTISKLMIFLGENLDIMNWFSQNLYRFDNKVIVTANLGTLLPELLVGKDGQHVSQYIAVERINDIINTLRTQSKKLAYEYILSIDRSFPRETHNVAPFPPIVKDVDIRGLCENPSQSISLKNLIMCQQNGKFYCMDREKLKADLKAGKPLLNPVTGEQLPASFIAKVKKL